ESREKLDEAYDHHGTAHGPQCRQRLFELYAGKLPLGMVNWTNFVQRTDGASAAFIREMMRKPALCAADESSDSIDDRHLDEAIYELVVEGGALTQSLLGFGSNRPDLSPPGS